MRCAKLGSGMVGLSTLGGASAWAVEGVRQDNSGVFVWAFLGLCALIIAAQVVPALLMMVGAAKGVADGVKRRQQVPTSGESKGHS